MDDLDVPFIFVPKGGSEPTEWLARHPDAIKIPAGFVPRSRGPGARDDAFEIDLDSALEPITRSAGLPDEPAVPRGTAAVSVPSTAEEPSPEPEDPLTAYLRSQNAVRYYITSAAAERPGSDANTQASLGKPTFSGSVTASSTPRAVLASGATPEPPRPFDAAADLKQGVTDNPDGTVKSMMVLAVTLPDGTRYIPKTRVKNEAQARRLGLPIGTEIPIPVPKTQDPEGMVEDWRKGRMANPLLPFAWHWHPYGPNDYKRNTPPVPIFDAYGNFEYGARGAAKGFSHELLLNMPQYMSFGRNDPINQADIESGYNAIRSGGRLSEMLYVLPPHSK